MITELTAANFDEEVKHASVPVLVDFWAVWCVPCRMLSPLVEQLAEDWAGKVKFCKVNVDDQPQLAAAYRIGSIPTLICFRDGAPAASCVGAVPRETIEAMLN